MVLPMIIVGILILAIVVYIALKVLKNIVIGVALIALVLVASFIIFGSFPSLSDVPFLGQFLPQTPTTPGEAIIALRDVLYHLDIVGYSRDSQNSLLVAVMNTGKASLTGMKVYVDNATVGILNPVAQTLPSKDAEIIQTNWTGPFSSIFVMTDQANATLVS